MHQSTRSLPFFIVCVSFSIKKQLLDIHASKEQVGNHEFFHRLLKKRRISYFPTYSIQHSLRCSQFQHIRQNFLKCLSSRKKRKKCCTRENVGFIVIFLSTGTVDKGKYREDLIFYESMFKKRLLSVFQIQMHRFEKYEVSDFPQTSILLRNIGTNYLMFTFAKYKRIYIF
jgi:hypothetical protein